MEWLIPVGVGIAFFLFFGVENCVEAIANAGVKKAEAAAKAEEHRTERVRLELERAKFEHDKTQA